jgi:hypothetical protein
MTSWSRCTISRPIPLGVDKHKMAITPRRIAQRDLNGHTHTLNALVFSVDIFHIEH